MRVAFLVFLLWPGSALPHELSMGKAEVRNGKVEWLGPTAAPTLTLTADRLEIAGTEPGFVTVVKLGDAVVAVHGNGSVRLKPPAGAVAGGEAGDASGSLFAVGVRHVLSGWDHLLFVFGLVLLVAGLRALVLAVTAFTVGHSGSLALAVLGGVTAPSAAVEALIALSVLLLARELVVDGDSLTKRKPWLAAGGFGLVHGLGFAGALSALGLSGAAAVWPLITFNLGVEAGQLGFVAVVLLARALAGRVRWPDPLRLAPAYAMGALAGAWVLERLAAMGGG